MTEQAIGITYEVWLASRTYSFACNASNCSPASNGVLEPPMGHSAARPGPW